MFITINVSVGDDRYARNATQEQIQIEIPGSLLKLIKPQLSTMINEVTNKVLDLKIDKLEAPAVMPEVEPEA